MKYSILTASNIRQTKKWVQIKQFYSRYPDCLEFAKKAIQGRPHAMAIVIAHEGQDWAGTDRHGTPVPELDGSYIVRHADMDEAVLAMGRQLLRPEHIF